MLTRFAALAALVLAFTAAPSLPDSGTAQAFPLTPYDQCVIEAYYGCFPRDEFGNIRPPDMGDIIEGPAFEACYAAALAACDGLEGDPD